MSLFISKHSIFFFFCFTILDYCAYVLFHTFVPLTMSCVLCRDGKIHAMKDNLTGIPLVFPLVHSKIIFFSFFVSFLTQHNSAACNVTGAIADDNYLYPNGSLGICFWNAFCWEMFNDIDLEIVTPGSWNRYPNFVELLECFMVILKVKVFKKSS